MPRKRLRNMLVAVSQILTVYFKGVGGSIRERDYLGGFMRGLQVEAAKRGVKY